MSRRFRAGFAATSALVLVFTTAACSSSKKTASSSTTTHSGPALSGTPVKGTAIYDLGTQTAVDDQEGIKVGVAAVNAAGGINGHPLDISVCTDNEDPNGAAACARTATSDSSVLAIVGTGTSYGASVDPILTAAGMASVGNSTYVAADFSCTVCFNDATGGFSSIGSAVAAVKTLNAKRIGVPYIDLPAGATLAPTVDKLVKPLGAQSVGVIPVPVTAADVTPQAAAEGAAKPDAIIDGLTTDLFAKFIHAYRQQGFDTPFIISGGVFDPAGIQSQLSGVNSNIYIDTEYDHSSNGYKTFLADFNKYDSSYSNHDDEVLRAYFAVKEFAYAASHASSLTKAGILAEMNSLNNYTSDGLQPPIDYTTSQTGLGGTAPRVIVDHIWMDKYQNGQFVPVGDGSAINVFTGTSS
ncbi:MAG: ABC transporter substrate-binding protein [Acidimicrobiales bacterium]|nr:ABC transporter substrate-binding protein [Acidimicrobiales bacterium]